jgi:hypothetical protein
MTMAYKTAGEAIDQQARDYAAEHHVEYAEALARVMGAKVNRLLVARHDQEVLGADVVKFDDGDEPESNISPYEAGMEVDKRVRVHMAEYGNATYQEAMHAILDADPAVKAAYHQSQPMD